MKRRISRAIGGIWQYLRDPRCHSARLAIRPSSPAIAPLPVAPLRPSLEFLADMGCNVEARLRDVAQPQNQIRLTLRALPPPPPKGRAGRRSPPG